MCSMGYGFYRADRRNVCCYGTGLFRAWYSFEADPAPDWNQGKGVAFLDDYRPHSGTGCFHAVPGSGVTLNYRYALHLPVLKEPRARLLRVTLWVRTLHMSSGELSVTS